MTITTLERTIPHPPAGLSVVPDLPESPAEPPALRPAPFPRRDHRRRLRPRPAVGSRSAPPAFLLTTQPGHRPLRLTRRGRLVVTLSVLACVVALVGLARGSDSPTGGRPSALTSVVVQPGDTLWQVAVRADPQADPRVTVERIAELNHLSGATVRPGQTLRFPRR